MTRTRDLLITNQLLYRLSYTSKYSLLRLYNRLDMIAYFLLSVNTHFSQNFFLISPTDEYY